MTIGFPQPRVRALGSSAIAASIFVAIVALSVASCSGGGTGNQMRPDGGGGNKKDMGGRPAGGRLGGDGRWSDDTEGADRTGLPDGDGLRVDLLRRRRLLQERLRGNLRDLRRAGNVGTCIPADVGTDPRNECADQGVASCGTDGNCDGTGACEKYVAGVACQSAGCSGSMLTFAGRCDGLGTCNVQAEPVLRSLRLQHDRRQRRFLQDGLHGRRRLLRRQQLQQRQLRAQAAGRELRRRRRLQVDPLCAGGLLLDDLHRHLQVVRGRQAARGPASRFPSVRIRSASAPIRAPPAA